MRRRSISTATALAVLFSSAVLTVTVAGSASAAATTLTTPGGMVADAALQRVFVADTSNGSIAAADWTGALVKRVTGISGVSGLALSDDGATLYAAAPGSHEIVALDAATLGVKQRWAVDTDTGPRHIAFAAGKVWFTYGDQWDGDLGSVDPNWAPAPQPTDSPQPSDTPTVLPSDPVDPQPTDTTTPPADATTPPADATTPPADETTPPADATTPPADETTPTAEPTPPLDSVEPQPTDTTTPPADTSTPPEVLDSPQAVAAEPSAPADGPVSLGLFPYTLRIYDGGLLDTDPSSPGLLAVGETGISTDSMAVLDVSSGTPVGVAYYNGDYTLNDGIGDIDLVPGAPQVLVNGTMRDAYADGKFSAAGSYPSSAGNRADVNQDGTVATWSGSSVSVFRPNGTQPLRTMNTGGNTADVVWAPDASRLFALVASGSGYVLKPLTGPTLNVPKLTVSAPSKGTIGTKLTVTGKISVVTPLPSGARLTVTRTDVVSTGGKALASVTPKADGTFSFTDTPPAGGNVVYKVAYAGDATHTSVSASDTVVIPRTTPSLSLNNNGKLYSYGADVTFTAHLGKTYSNRKVELWADPFGSDKGNRLLKSGTVNSSGNISVVVDMTRDTKVTAVFRGDARTAPRTVASTGYAKVKISNSVSHYYRTGVVGSHSYYWFHKKTAPVINTTMTYYPGRKERLDLQIYYNGAWRTGDSEYFKLGSNGKISVDLGAPGTSGIKARVRTSYINASSGDNVNSTTYGPWKYLYFTS